MILLFNAIMSIRYKVLKIIIAILAAFVGNGLFYLLSGGKIELIPVKWLYENTNIFISLIALYITIYTYISIDKVSSISQMEGNPLEEIDYFGSVFHKVQDFDALDEASYIQNIKTILTDKLNRVNHPYAFSNALEFIIDSLVLYAAIGNNEKTKVDETGKDFKKFLIDEINQKYLDIKNKFFIASRSSQIMIHSIKLIEAILYYQQKNEYDELMDFHLLISIDSNYILNKSSRVLYHNYYGLYHQRHAIQLTKQSLDINTDRLFTVDGIKTLLNKANQLTAKQRFMILNKLEDAIHAFDKALSLASSSDIWTCYLYFNLSRSEYLYNVLSHKPSYNWLKHINQAIDDRFRVNEQLSYIEYERYVSNKNHKSKTRDKDYEQLLKKETTYLKAYYRYQESFAKLVKYSILIAQEEDIYDSKGALICPKDGYPWFDIDIPNRDNPKLKPFIENIERIQTK